MESYKMGKSKDIFSEKYPAHTPEGSRLGCVWFCLVAALRDGTRRDRERRGAAFSPDAGVVLENPGADPKCVSPMSVGGPRQVIRVHAATGL